MIVIHQWWVIMIQALTRNVFRYRLRFVKIDCWFWPQAVSSESPFRRNADRCHGPNFASNRIEPFEHREMIVNKLINIQILIFKKLLRRQKCSDLQPYLFLTLGRIFDSQPRLENHFFSFWLTSEKRPLGDAWCYLTSTTSFVQNVICRKFSTNTCRKCLVKFFDKLHFRRKFSTPLVKSLPTRKFTTIRKPRDTLTI